MALSTMAAPVATAQQQFVLPILIFGLPEVRRLKLELEALEDFMRQSQIREPGKQPQLPRLSRMCEALAAENKLNLLQDADRKNLQLFLTNVVSTAPTLHISFAADPSSAFTAKVVTWMRTQLHPYALLQVGLQPTIAAGCVVRTLNKEFDFSLRENLIKHEDLLMAAIEAEAASVVEPTPINAPAAVVATVPAAVPEQSGAPAPAAPVSVTVTVAPTAPVAGAAQAPTVTVTQTAPAAAPAPAASVPMIGSRP
ncbi:MAG TPA: hypothetical protein VLI54_06185 [Bacillota bacterium]|nr:hypothetical protein [Bacillota bacterium]